MDARSELLAYLGAAVATVALLFGLQIWYASYLDTHVVNVHPADAPANAKIAARRQQEQAKLAAGRMPIAQAKAALAQRGRSAFPNLVPKASEDLSPMAGWMHRPNFKPYTPRPAQVAPAAPAEAGQIEGAGAAAPVAGAAPSAATQPSETALATPERPAARRRAPAVQPEPVVKTTPGATPAVQP